MRLFVCFTFIVAIALTSKYFFNTDVTILCHHSGITHLKQCLYGSLNKVVGVSRTFGLGQHVLNSGTFQNGTHSATGYNSCTRRSRTEQYFCTTVLGNLLVRYGSFINGDSHQIFLGGFYTFSNGSRNFTGFAQAIA